MKIVEKKALRSATEALETRMNAFREKTGIGLQARIEATPIESYDFDALSSAKVDVLQVLGKVPGSIVDAMATIAEDEDYREAFGELSSIVFIPVDDARGSSFDYDASMSLNGAEVEVRYAPLAYMHGGYERALKNLF